MKKKLIILTTIIATSCINIFAAQNEVIKSFINDNSKYFQAGIGVNEKTNLPLDYVIVEKDSKAITQSNFVNPMTIGMYLMSMMSIEQVQLTSDTISKDEAKERISKVLEILNPNGKTYKKISYEGFFFWLTIDENGNIERQKAADNRSTISTVDNTYLAMSLAAISGAYKDTENKKFADIANNILSKQTSGWYQLWKYNDNGKLSTGYKVDPSTATNELKTKDGLLGGAKSDDTEYRVPCLDKPCLNEKLLEQLQTEFTANLELLKSSNNAKGETAAVAPELFGNVDRLTNENRISPIWAIIATQDTETPVKDEAFTVIGNFYKNNRPNSTIDYKLLGSGETLKINPTFRCGMQQAFLPRLFLDEENYSAMHNKLLKDTFSIQDDFVKMNEYKTPVMLTGSYIFKDKAENNTLFLGCGVLNAGEDKGEQDKVNAQSFGSPFAVALLAPYNKSNATEQIRKLQSDPFYKSINSGYGWYDSINAKGQTPSRIHGMHQGVLLSAFAEKPITDYINSYLSSGQKTKIKDLYSKATSDTDTSSDKPVKPETNL